MIHGLLIGVLVSVIIVAAFALVGWLTMLSCERWPPNDTDEYGK